LISEVNGVTALLVFFVAIVEVDVDADVPISDDATERAPPAPGFPTADVFLEVRVADELVDANHALDSSIL
jgi:hypothetical protein